ncbi:DUF2529 family protein [Geomicrobium sp. JCM 19039]|uniref:DUF2529 family protein n=1 Tax=Geomicrobium sp. JCM 19039 TaxID=1460636 RepID=UPI00045F306D|nr:DUF2529 family protein [Geomicrobium sp. JCM 19039]GAK14461.1 hypothetical protein JCM19039_4384 [Geomicrobium sp. JCM 19039]
MMKMYTTQLQRVFTLIQNQEEQIEESSRMLAAALVGEGTIYLCASARFQSLAQALTENPDTLDKTVYLPIDDAIKVVTPADRLVYITEESDNEDDNQRLQQILSAETPVVFLGSAAPDLQRVEGMEEPFYVETSSKGLVPNLDGSRSGYPGEIAIVYAYQLLMFHIGELLD